MGLTQRNEQNFTSLLYKKPLSHYPSQISFHSIRPLETNNIIFREKTNFGDFVCKMHPFRLRLIMSTDKYSDKLVF